MAYNGYQYKRYFGDSKCVEYKIMTVVTGRAALGGGVQGSGPPASNRTTHEIRANPEIFLGGGESGAVNRQLFIDISCVLSCAETWASNGCRSHA